MDMNFGFENLNKNKKKKKKKKTQAQKITNIICGITVGVFVFALVLFLFTPNKQSKNKAEEVITTGTETVRFSLNGDKVTKLYIGDTYEEPGFSLTGSKEDLRKYVTITGEVDTTTKGKYQVTYDFNYNGITSQLTRYVIVYDEFMIKIKGGETFRVLKGTTFADPGATAKDGKDGDLTSSIKVDSNVNVRFIVSDA